MRISNTPSSLTLIQMNFQNAMGLISLLRDQGLPSRKEKLSVFLIEPLWEIIRKETIMDISSIYFTIRWPILLKEDTQQ